MILKNKKVFYEESGLEKFQARVKSWVSLTFITYNIIKIGLYCYA